MGGQAFANVIIFLWYVTVEPWNYTKICFFDFYFSYCPDFREHSLSVCLQSEVCWSQAQLLQHSQVSFHLWYLYIGKKYHTLNNIIGGTNYLNIYYTIFRVESWSCTGCPPSPQASAWAWSPTPPPSSSPWPRWLSLAVSTVSLWWPLRDISTSANLSTRPGWLQTVHNCKMLNPCVAGQYLPGWRLHSLDHPLLIHFQY